MVNFDFGLICETAIIDQQTNHLSVIKVIEGFNFLAFPANLPRLYMITAWSRDKASSDEQEVVARLRFIEPNHKDGDKIFTSNFDVILPKGKRRLRAIIEISGLPVNSAGEYELCVEVKTKNTWNRVGGVYFDVSNSPMPEKVAGLPK